MRRADQVLVDYLSSFLGKNTIWRSMSVVLRMSALAAKFASVFIMAKFLTPTDFGAYGLLAAGVGYATYLVGADYYTFSNRELIRTSREHRGSILKNQVVASAATYMVVIPLIVAASYLGLLPVSLIFWFFLLLFVEHVGQESMRLLVALGHPAIAAYTLFVRTGLWPLVVVPIFWFWPEARHLPLVLACWAACGFLSSAISISFIWRANLGGWRNPIAWAWIRRGFRIAALFLLGSLALRAMFTIDRFWMEKLASAEVLGAYIFYMTIAGALPALLEAGVFTFEYPAMIAAYPTLDPIDRRRHAKGLLLRVGFICLAYAVVAASCLPLALRFVNRFEYGGHAFFFVAGMAAMILYVLSLVPHFALYSLGKDRSIVAGNIVGLLVFLPVTIALRPVLPIHDTIPAGLCVAFLILLSWKWIGFSRASSLVPSQTAKA